MLLLRVAKMPKHVTQLNILEMYVMGKVTKQYVIKLYDRTDINITIPWDPDSWLVSGSMLRTKL